MRGRDGRARHRGRPRAPRLGARGRQHRRSVRAHALVRRPGPARAARVAARRRTSSSGARRRSACRCSSCCARRAGCRPSSPPTTPRSSGCATTAPSPGASRRARCASATASRSSRPASRTTVTGIQVAGADVDRGRRAAVGVGAARRRRRRRARRVDRRRRTRCPTGRREIDAELFQLDARPLTAGARVLVKHGTATVQAVDRPDRVALRPRRPRPRARRRPCETNDIGRARLRLAADLPSSRTARTARAARSWSSIRPTARHSPPASCATDLSRTSTTPHCRLKEANREHNPHRDDDHHSGTCGRDDGRLRLRREASDPLSRIGGDPRSPSCASATSRTSPTRPRSSASRRGSSPTRSATST